MKENYGAMTREQLVREQQRLHKKLTVPNIVILLISLVAAFSLIFGTLFSVNVHIDSGFMDTVTELQSSGEGSADSADEEEMQEMMSFLMKDVDLDVSVSLYPRAVFAAAFSGSEGISSLIVSAVPDLEALVSKLGEQVAPAMISYAVMAAMGDLPESFDDIDTQAFAETIRLINEQDAAGAKTAFLDASETFADEQLGITLTDEDRANISDAFDEMLEAMTDENGHMSVTNLIFDMFGNGSENSGGSVTVVESVGLFNMESQVPDGESGTESGSQDGSDGETSEGAESGDPAAENPLGEMMAMLEDPASIVENMSDETRQTIRLVCTVISVVVLVCAGCWALLALFALLHIFTRNKKVGMWYVKLTGIIPCLIFFILPTVAMKIMPNVIPDFPAALASMPLSFGGLTIISAVCLLVLWAVSIFWCHPIKKRIKQCKKRQRAIA